MAEEEGGGGASGLVIKFSYDLSSGMDQGIQDYYRAMGRLQRAAKSQSVKINFDWSGSEEKFEEINKLIEETIGLIELNREELARAGGDVSKISAISKRAFDENAANIEKNLKKINEFSSKLENMPMTMQTSVTAMRRQLASLSAQWDEMSVGEKFSGKGFSKLTAEAKALLKAYIAIKEQIDENGQSLDTVARKEREKSLLRKKDLTTEAEYLEKIRILEERVANARIGTSKRTKYIAELEATREKYEAISHSQRKVNKNQDEMKAKIALTDAQMKRLNDSFRLADHYTGRLLVRLAAYAGVALFARMLRNIREVTAEFELQQVALGAIIQDTEKASTLFEQIKTQAVRSPFEVKELVTYTKQLAAYRVESERLFDVTMQLADISSALGVDMQRLILAYGQVKAASVLRGQELRQFTEAGIPLVQKLADKFTELRGRLVSTGEVFELISRRAVSFGMIEEIFNDMTAAGGEFYKMQEKQAETLKGRWTNLKDAISIAYDEIGRSNLVNSALNGLIGLTSTLAKNWRKVNTIVLTTAGAISFFAVASKNAKLAASALTQEGLKQAIVDGKLALQKTKHATATEKLTKAERRRNVFLTRANAATKKAVMATNMFERAVYKLSASINRLWAAVGPAGWIVLGITAIASVVTLFKKRAESLQETLAKTKERAADYINLLQRTPRDEKILDQYDKLSEKMDKTAEESKKLLDISKRLASVYPEQATLVDAEAMAYKIDTEEIRKNTEAKQENMRTAIVGDISELEKRRDKIEERLKDFYVYDGALFDRRGKWNDNLADIRQRFMDLHKELNDVNSAIKASQDALNYQMIKSGLKGWDQLWKNQIKTLSIVNKEQRGFADDTIENFQTIEEAWEEAAKQYKEREETLQQLKTSLESPALLDGKQRAEIEASIGLLEDEKQAYAAILDYYNQKGGRKTKTDTSMFKDELDLVKRIYKKYVDLRKLQSEPEAKESIKAAYGNLTAIDFLSPEELAARIANIRQRALLFAARSSDEDVKKAINEFVDTATEEIDNVSYVELENAIKTRLDNLAKDLSAAKEANKFYDEIFGKTFDRGLAEAFTASIYGADRTSARNALKTYVSEVFGADIADIAFADALMPDWGYLEEIFKERASTMGEDQKKAAQDILTSGRKTSEEQFRVWVSDLAKEKDIMDKRIDLHRQTVQRIREIEGESDANLNASQKSQLIEQYRKREQKLASDIAYQAFKESPVYTQLFSNLDNASVDMLRRLKQNIEGLKAEWDNNLDPANLKELQSRIENIDKLLVQKRPFEILTKSLKEYWKNSDKRKNADRTAFESAKAAKAQLEVALEYDRQLEDAEQVLRDMQEGRTTATEDEMQAQQNTVNLLRLRARTERGLYENAKKRADSDAKDADHWREINELIIEAANVILGYQEQLTQMNDLIFKIAAAWQHADDIQKEYLNNLREGINKMIGGVAELGKGILEIKGGNYFEGVVDVLVGLERTIEGVLNTTNAQKLREINRELEAQDKALKNLEKAYDDLRYAEDKVFGSEWVTNRKREIDVLEAKAAAYEKKAEEEMKKRDKDRNEQQAEQYLDEADAIRKEISRREHEISEKMVGTDAASAAREFASAWLDAYKSYGNTLDAMDEKFQDLIENMVKESLMARVIKDNIIDPIMAMFDQLDETANKEDYIKALQSSLEYYEGAKGKVNDIMMALQEVLRQYGIDFQSTASGLHGISKDIAQASESSILGLAAGINTQNYYISSIYGSVTQIVELLQGGSSRYAPARGEGGAATGDYSTYLSTIQGHTSSMASDLSAIRQALAGLVVLKGNAKALNVK